ncbi:Peptidase M23 [Pseudopedobacter saltans DSM 12145]|uniref:Peptidase M23 n=1 Tax=Pseudopedobacter saltans (strain ATCC 51119 / DSM 12145 / JCM 21818 / CCUG 39354 / LMG 10337 / NBRC 100064 / NCIMB 13643) TaxID=762903 RepID=F0S509_PSESL|nr:M23 family metallopeptidase [Pseudopedobacter saltans]ADY50926.1 Peptidase M23 [Pseudopedobacter saltans DSM 12145]
MAKTKYYFNSQTLKYEKVKLSLKIKILKAIGFISTAMVFSFIIIALAYTFLDSPKEQQLKREINQLSLQYEILQERLKKTDNVLQVLEDRDDNIYRVIFEAEPISKDVRNAGFGGVNRYKSLENYEYGKLMMETTKKMDILSKKLYVQSKSYDELTKLVNSKEKMISSIPAIQPVDSRKLRGAISGFGYRIHPIYKIRKMHSGIDFTAPVGTPIYATGDGVVIAQGNERGYGNRIMINHGYGYVTKYAHMSKFKAKKGERVKRGDLIGYVGNTGASTGPHLHYEVFKNGKVVNPMNFFFNDLTPAEYIAMLEMASKENQSFD